MEETKKKFQAEIDNLETKMIRYKKQDDQYSWHIENEQQKIWIKALEILNVETVKSSLDCEIKSFKHCYFHNRFGCGKCNAKHNLNEA